jgi:glycosyltransferase involved in cell wall biosynthesis
MHVGIELGQIKAQSSGGIVPLLEGVLRELFPLASGEHFFVYHTATGYRPPEPLPANVRSRALGEGSFWRELDRALAQDGIDVLFRGYPSDVPIAFPMRRQIVLVPDLQHEVMPEFFDPQVLARRQVAFEHAIGGAGALAVLSEYGRATLLAHHPHTPAEVFPMPPASALHPDELDRPLSPEEQAALPAEPFFLFPANLWPHKNHRTLFAALEILRQRGQPVALVLTGDPAGWPELQADYPDLPISHLGFVSRPLLAELYRRAQALAYFSLYEGFGIPLLEAFASGTPVLCSNTTCLPEIGGDAVLSCDPTDAQALAALMARILDDGELRGQLVERGRRRLDQYSWRQSAQNLLDACERVASAPVEHAALLSAVTLLAEQSDASNAKIGELQAQLAASEADRAARLEAIRHLQARLDESAAQQELIGRLSADLAASEADRAARLEAIQHLQAQLAESEADCAAQVELTQRLQAQLAESEADRAARLDAILRQEAVIYKLRTDLSAAQSRLWLRVGRKVKRILVSAWQS